MLYPPSSMPTNAFLLFIHFVLHLIVISSGVLFRFTFLSCDGCQRSTLRYHPPHIHSKSSGEPFQPSLINTPFFDNSLCHSLTLCLSVCILTYVVCVFCCCCCCVFCDFCTCACDLPVVMFFAYVFFFDLVVGMILKCRLGLFFSSAVISVLSRKLSSLRPCVVFVALRISLIISRQWSITAGGQCYLRLIVSKKAVYRSNIN